MFDLLSAEYGWTDGQILDLTLPRLWLARDAVFARRRADQRRQAELVELQTRHIAQAVLAAAGDKKADKHASQISFFGDDDGPRQSSKPRPAPVRQVVAGAGRPLLDGRKLIEGAQRG